MKQTSKVLDRVETTAETVTDAGYLGENPVRRREKTIERGD